MERTMFKVIDEAIWNGLTPFTVVVKQRVAKCLLSMEEGKKV
jgi:hypothetical protein